MPEDLLAQFGQRRLESGRVEEPADRDDGECRCGRLAADTGLMWTRGGDRGPVRVGGVRGSDSTRQRPPACRPTTSPATAPAPALRKSERRVNTPLGVVAGATAARALDWRLVDSPALVESGA